MNKVLPFVREKKLAEPYMHLVEADYAAIELRMLAGLQAQPRGLYGRMGRYPEDPTHQPSAIPDAPWAALGEGMAMDFPTGVHSRPKVQRAAHRWGRWLGRVFQVSVLRLPTGVQVARVTRIK